jgi:uncharacterized protein YuzE
MRITYDKSADAVYIYLIPNKEIRPGWSKKTYPCDPAEVGGMINLDFDEKGRLGGIEILGANHKLPKEILDSAEVIGSQ